MKLEIKNINSSLNKAYLAQSTFIDEISKFKDNYANLLKSIKQNDNEETLKDYINIFFRDTYYKNKFTIKENVNNIDLVIYNGKEENGKIGVIVETKAIKSNEMITTKDLNKKAFQELIQYYLEERTTNNNLEIKHLIITNSIDWFIFNASEFERIFYQNKSFLKKYVDWTNGQLVNKNKDWFYSEIAKPFIQDQQDTIVCTHFQLSKNLIENENSTIELYKIFSPEHLLKLPFQNDSNTLNRDFYNELLHIIGLYETKGNTRKIERLPEQNRNEGSLIENIISIIETDDIIQNLEQTERYGENLKEQLFSIGLELCITWLNRILFLKLLEGQLIKYNNNNFDFAFLNNQKIKDFEELKTLFFEILAVTPKDRKSTLQQKYEKVPYLNSSLFELTTLEKETVKVNHLKHNTSLPIFSGTVLKDSTGKRKAGELPVLQYIFEFLDSYNFASDNKVEIQEHNKTVINSSVLGLIFEKLNGYKEGSFFTPGFITMYICKETIRKTVIQKFNTAYNWNCTNIKPQLYNKISEIDLEKANETFNSIRICDPAVGSGHFLVSALNELIAIKSELGILIDSNGQLLRNTYCEVQNDELFISHFGQFFNYNFTDKESQRIQETIFKEKRIIIENCLFGVDINPKSVQICRLRLWIELLKNSFYTKESNYTNLETLPNIDINIKTGNSLVSRFSLNGNGFSVNNKQKMQLATKKYKDQVSLYKSTNDKKTKNIVEKTIAELKKDYAEIVNPNDEELKIIRQKIAEINSKPLFFSREEEINWLSKYVQINNEITELDNKYKEKLHSIYSNSFEWRFEFPEVLDETGNYIGFDVVIGNPPYGIFNKKQNQKTALSTVNAVIDFYKERYQPAIEGMINASKLFYLLGFNLLNSNGINGMIIPYGFLTDISSSKLRKYIFENHTILTIDAFPERDNPSKRIFEEAKISTAILITKKQKAQDVFDLGISYTKKISEERLKLSFKEIKTLSGEKCAIPLINKNKLDVLLKIAECKTIKLKNISECLTGEVDISLAKDAITDNKNDNPLIKGVQIDRYTLKLKDEEISQGKIQYLNLKKFEKIYSGNKLTHSKSKRIVLQGLTGVNEKRRIKATIVNENNYLANSCNYLVINNNFNYKFILALLNSQLFNFIFKCNSTNSNVNGYEINELPVITEINSSKIEKLVDKIFQNKEKNNSNYNFSKDFESIDKEIYKLYNLTNGEITIIEGK